MQTCETCQGSGRMIVPPEHAQPNDASVACVDCEGTGKRTSLADDLRAVADFIEDRPTIMANLYLPYMFAHAGDRQEFTQLCRELGASTKAPTDFSMILERRFGTITVGIVIGRDQVCKKRVVGKRLVPAKAEYEEEIVEWDCERIFSDDAVVAEAE